ncbi:MAG: hypothetical protein HYX90_03515 [Chloroflexi bacterium]|nr:hypothetical protein [Chloroflexota bacterium]
MNDSGQPRLRNRQVIIVRGRRVLGEPAVEKEQVTYRDRDGLQDEESVGLPLCQAGCVIHDEKEIAAIDKDTREVLCPKHAQTECASCHDKVGPRSEMRLLGKSYCRAHGTRLVVFWGAVILAGVLMLPVMARGCGSVYL